jgi:hypothetical protein
LTKPVFGPKMVWARQQMGLVPLGDSHHGGC